MNDIQRAYLLRTLQTLSALPCNVLIEAHEEEARGRWLVINLKHLTTTVVSTLPELPSQKPTQTA